MRRVARRRRRQLEDRPRAGRAATAPCSRWSAGRGARRTTSGSTAPSACSATCSTEAVAAPASRPTTGRSPRSAGSCSPAPTCREEERACTRRSAARGWAARSRCATTPSRSCAPAPSAGWGVAVVCGAGINCVGVAPDGRAGALPGARADHRRLGRRLGRRARGGSRRRRAARTGAAQRPRSSAPCRRTSGWRRRRSSPRRCTSAGSPPSGSVELAPVVLAEAEADAVARAIVDRLAAEIVALARVALTRLDLLERAGRGAARRRADALGRGALVEAVAPELARVAPRPSCARNAVAADASAPGCSALDELGADAEAQAPPARARRGGAATIGGADG